MKLWPTSVFDTLIFLTFPIYSSTSCSIIVLVKHQGIQPSTLHLYAHFIFYFFFTYRCLYWGCVHGFLPIYTQCIHYVQCIKISCKDINIARLLSVIGLGQSLSMRWTASVNPATIMYCGTAASCFSTVWPGVVYCTWHHLQSVGNNDADTRGHRIIKLREVPF